jgi:hypothetical protein
LSEKVSRRGYAKYAGGGIVVIAVAGIGAYYATRPGPSPTTVAPTTEAPATKTTAEPTPTPTETYPPASEDPLIFNQWPWRADLVEEFLNTFREQYDESVTHQVQAGNYPAVIEMKHISRSALDSHYAIPMWAHKFYNATWTLDLEDAPRIDDAKRDMFPLVKDALTSPMDNKIVGLPYYNLCYGTVLTNEQILEQVGITTPDQYPKDYTELYEICEEIQKKNIVKSPWLPRIIGDWTGMYPFLWEGMARGDEIFDKNFDPTFDTNTPIADVLRDWQYNWEKEIMPHGVISLTEGDHEAWFLTGQYAFTETMDYNCVAFNEPGKAPISGSVGVVPVSNKQNWGILTACCYCLPNRERTDRKLERALQMHSFFGYKDKNDTFHVARTWAITSGLGTGYRGIYEDPEVIQAYKDRTYRPDDIERVFGLFEKAIMPAIWKLPWFTEWESELFKVIPDCIAKKISVEDAISTLRESAEALKKEYPLPGTT